MSAQYIIGRWIDPIYAVAIGFGAAFVRIRREEKDKGRKTLAETAEVLRRRIPLFQRAIGMAPKTEKAIGTTTGS